MQECTGIQNYAQDYLLAVGGPDTKSHVSIKLEYS